MKWVSCEADFETFFAANTNELAERLKIWREPTHLKLLSSDAGVKGTKYITNRPTKDDLVPAIRLKIEEPSPIIVKGGGNIYEQYCCAFDHEPYFCSSALTDSRASVEASIGSNGRLIMPNTVWISNGFVFPKRIATLRTRSLAKHKWAQEIWDANFTLCEEARFAETLWSALRCEAEYLRDDTNCDYGLHEYRNDNLTRSLCIIGTLLMPKWEYTNENWVSRCHELERWGVAGVPSIGSMAIAYADHIRYVLRREGVCSGRRRNATKQ